MNFFSVSNIAFTDPVFHYPMSFISYGLPGGASEIPRFKSKGHHTGGFVFREEALEDIEKMKAHLEGEGYTVGLSLEKDFLWDGVDVPASVLIFVEKDGKYTPV
jgi:hypothetical protein